MKKITIPEANIHLIVETASENVQDEIPSLAAIGRLTTSAEIKREYEHCFYCDGLVRRTSKQSGDHFPLPKRHGGTEIVPCCVSCHDMKDRFDIGQWPVEWLPKIIQDFPNLNRETRIFLARTLAIVADCIDLRRKKGAINEEASNKAQHSRPANSRRKRGPIEDSEQALSDRPPQLRDDSPDA